MYGLIIGGYCKWENQTLKQIGVLTSGGDAPAMNAAVRAVARIGKERGLKVKGIRKGYNGLLNEDIIEFNTNRNSRYDLPWRYNPFHSQM